MKELAPYQFELPPERIAQTPPARRGASRLMAVPREGGRRRLAAFDDLPSLLPPGALMVFNEVRVTPARLIGLKPQSGGRLEAFILDPPTPDAPPGDYDLWCLVHPGRRVKAGSDLEFSRRDSETLLRAQVLEVDGQGRRLIRFHFEENPAQTLEEVGHVPLPFYIKRPDGPQDRERYQTVYGRTHGAVAAPTAGLHFTAEMLERLAAQGFGRAFITLKVSAGTFAPLTEEQLATGRLHREHITVPPETAEAARRARAEGRPVVAVGTTSVRALEWAAGGGAIEAAEGWGDIFIRPGYEFKAVDGLVTNFHLPGSSLLMLVAALAGRENILAAYAEAIEAKMNFYSYGDAMLIHG